MFIHTSRLTPPPHGTPIKPTIAPMPKCPPPPGARSKTNPFDTSSVTLTKLEWRYILHALYLCEYNQDGAEEAEMNEHCQKVIEEASE